MFVVLLISDAPTHMWEPPEKPGRFTSTLHTLVQLVNAGLGYTLIPQMAIEAGILDGTRVEPRRPQGLEAVRQIALVWRSGHPRTSEFRLLGATLRRAVGRGAPETD